MSTPSTALFWELWRQHRARFIVIIGLLPAFALIYPKLCALSHYNPHSSDSFEELINGPAIPGHEASGLLRIVRTLYFLFLLIGPMVALFLSLLYVIWTFTFSEIDSQTKDFLKFPTRLFNLPVSTPFFFWRFSLGGLLAVAVLYESWVLFVPMPRISVFGGYQNCFAWMTLLAVAQGIVWALAAWPGTRVVILSGAGFVFLVHEALHWPNIFAWPFVLPLGMALGFAGLRKMRRGEWQGITWRPAARATLSGPKQFSSPAAAQLWFEWRRFGRLTCLVVASFGLVAVIGCLIAHAVSHWPSKKDDLFFVPILLAGAVLLIHFCFGMSPGRADRLHLADESFVLVRPLASGQIFMPMLKSAAISAVLSTLLALAAASVILMIPTQTPMLPPFLPKIFAAFVCAFMFVTWRLAVVNLCFVLTGRRRLLVLPVLLIYTLGASMPFLIWLSHNGVYWNEFLHILPALLLLLVFVKFLLAFLSFGASLRRRLIEPRAVEVYLTVWMLLVGGVLAAMVILFQPGMHRIVPVVLGAILLVPLARIGACPIALASHRHG